MLLATGLLLAGPLRAAYVVLQQIESNLLTPLVLQRTVSLHPAVVIAAVTAAGAAFGILGILAGMLGFVPYLGPILSAIPPLLLALVGDSIDAVWILLSYLAIQQVEGYLLKPLIEGKTASLHPAVVIVAA